MQKDLDSAHSPSKQAMPPQESQHAGESYRSSELSSHLGEILDADQDAILVSQRRQILRIQIQNESSGRRKDLVVDICENRNLYNDVYDNPTVKEAHVRKYSAPLVQDVKKGLRVIQCCIWDEALGRPCHTFSVEQLKETTTQQLYELVPESDLVKLMLRCVLVEDEEMESSGHGVEGSSDVAAIAATAPASAPEETPLHPPAGVAMPPSHPVVVENGGGVSRCPFSGVAVNSDLLESFRNQMAARQKAEEEEDDEQISLNSEKGSIGSEKGSVNSDGTAHGAPSPCSSVATQEDAEEEHPSTDRPKRPDRIRVRVTNQVSQQSGELIVDLSDSVSLHKAIYECPTLIDGMVRRWNSETVAKIRAGMMHVQLAVMSATTSHEATSTVVHSYTLDQLGVRSTNQLFDLLHEQGISTNEIVNLQLQCVPVSDMNEPLPSSNLHHPPVPTSFDLPDHTGFDRLPNIYVSQSLSLSQFDSSCASFLPLEYVEGGAQESHRGSLSHSVSVAASLDNEGSGAEGTFLVKPKQILRIRITNRSSQRFKDLVVDINDSTNLYDSVYNNPLTIQAHVRKWGAQHVNEVKTGRAEIQVVCWDDDSARPWRTFGVEELKRTTTRNLYEAVPESCDLVTLFLDCVPKKTPVTQPIATSTDTPTLRIRNGKPESTPSLRSSTSESCLKRPARKRLNHMTLSSVSSQASSKTDESSGNSGLEHDVTVMANVGSDKAVRTSRMPIRPHPSGQKMDIDAFLMQSRGGRQNMRSMSTDDLKSNAKWTSSLKTPRALPPRRSSADVLAESLEKSGTLEAIGENSLAAKVNRFLSMSTVQATKSQPSNDGDRSGLGASKEERMKAFMRLYNAKKASALQSQEFKASLKEELPTNDLATNSSSLNAKFPTIVHTNVPEGNPLLSRVSSLTLDERKSLSGFGKRPISSQASTAKGGIELKVNASSVSLPKILPPKNPNDPKVSDRINRFLRFSKPPQPGSIDGSRNLTSSQSNISLKSGSPSLASLPEEFRYTSPILPKSTVNDSSKMLDSIQRTDMPPVCEIEVITKEEGDPSTGISLSPALVKDVFPYHVVLSSDFRIIQVGNSLPSLMDQEVLTGRIISDVLMVTGPIPMFGKWDWNIVDKMKDKTVFLESVGSPSDDMKVKVKGTVIDISSSPRMVMLALFPNVKNLSELESMDLSMADLPLHSCQREAVLLGEHSKSEVKLTNHLDQLHRDLIDSMEKQIEDRTNELENANGDLARANQQLAIQSARQLEHFACMSHEIRTPLNCIVGMSSLLLDDADEMDPMHADSIRMINTSGDLLKAVVDDVLDYAKLESGSFEVDIKPTNLQETIASVVHSISQKVQEKNIRLRTHFSATLPLELETDSRRLQQVLFNLLGNAGKFSKPDSVIDLSLILMNDQFETSPTGKIIRFSVKDYGKGIDKADWKTIFEPFSQASKETQNIYGGTGLGLSITSKLVHRLGGTVGLDSQLGKYTEFTVDLPFAGTLVDADAVSARLGRTTLLLVEPAKVYDYTFSEYQILPEPMAFDSTVAEIYGLDVARCQSVDQAVQEMKKRTSEDKNRHFAFLIDEKLFYSGIPDQLESFVDPSQFTLMTVGPHYSIPLTKDWHFKSLLNFFPAALLDTIQSHIETQRDTWYSDGTELSPIIAPSVPPEANPKSPMKIEPDSIPRKSNQTVKSDMTRSSSQRGSLIPISSDSLIPGGLFSSLKSGGDFAPSANTLSKIDPVPGGLFASLQSAKDLNGVSRSRSAGSLSSDPSQEGRNKIEPSSRTSLGHAQGQNSNKPPPPPPGASPRFGQKTVDGLFGSLVATESSDAKVDSLSSSHRSNLSASAGSTSNLSLQDASTKVQGQRTTSKAKQTQKERDLRVLYCEDNLVNQKVLSRHLTRAGVKQIVIVDNGRKGVDLCEKESFDIIFMDYEMPVMDGMEATKLIVERDPDAVVIFVTAHALEKFKSKAEAVGASGFFSKPFKATDIESVLDLVADKKTTRTRNGLVPPAMVESSASTFTGSSPPSSLSPPLPPPPPDVSPISPRSPPGQTTTAPNLSSRVSPKPHASARSLKILMAEDNAVNQKVLSRVLNRAGVSDITIVDNGQKAVDLCRTVKFDAIFSDVEMPVLGGLEACKQIVAHDPQSLVVFVTAHTQAEFEPQANAVGAWGFLPKPFRLADVNAVLDRLEVACQKFPATTSTATTARSPSHAVNSIDVAEQEGKVDHPETFLKLASISSEASFSASTVSRNSSSAQSAHSSHSRRGIRRGSANGMATGRTFPLAEQSTMKVLYAEDNLVNQKVLARVLNRAGISDITVVDDGQKAVDICAKESFDVIFMDVQMPVLDGIAACKVIVERDPSAVVIFVTAHALDEFKMQAQSIGAQNFISKPFRLDDIKKVLSELSGTN